MYVFSSEPTYNQFPMTYHIHFMSCGYVKTGCPPSLPLLPVQFSRLVSALMHNCHNHYLPASLLAQTMNCIEWFCVIVAFTQPI